MKKLKEFYLKYKISKIITTVVTISAGVLIIMEPEKVSKFVIIMFGIIMLLEGVTQGLKTYKEFYCEKYYKENHRKEVIEYGIELFGSKKKFFTWYNSNKVTKDGKKPKEQTEIEIVEALERIEHGIYS